jgi:hypothetical protein
MLYSFGAISKLSVRLIERGRTVGQRHRFHPTKFLADGTPQRWCRVGTSLAEDAVRVSRSAQGTLVGTANPDHHPYDLLGYMVINGWTIEVHCPGCDRRDRVVANRLAKQHVPI